MLADDPPRQSGRGEWISAPRCRPGTEPRRKRPHGDRARDPPHGRISGRDGCVNAWVMAWPCCSGQQIAFLLFGQTALSPSIHIGSITSFPASGTHTSTPSSFTLLVNSRPRIGSSDWQGLLPSWPQPRSSPGCRISFFSYPRNSTRDRSSMMSYEERHERPRRI